MQSIYAARRAWPGPLAMALVLLGLLAMPVPAQAAPSQAPHEVAMAAAGWHGRAVQHPRPRLRLADTDWPQGWSARSVGLGSGYVRPGGSDRVREVQRRLIGLGYRPGPVDGLFGPRTRAATRWFQYKHGLALTGRVSRATLAVLQARSDHKPLPAITTGAPTRHRHSPTPVQPTPPAPQHAAGPQDQTGATWLIAAVLLLAALGLGVVAGFLIPELRRAKPARTAPAPAPARALPPAPASPAPLTARPRPRTPARTTTSPRVVGYALVEDAEDTDASTAALALRCAHRGWSLVEVIHDRRNSARRLSDRPGLMHALDHDPLTPGDRAHRRAHPRLHRPRRGPRHAIGLGRRRRRLPGRRRPPPRHLHPRGQRHRRGGHRARPLRTRADRPAHARGPHARPLHARRPHQRRRYHPAHRRHARPRPAHCARSPTH